MAELTIHLWLGRPASTGQHAGCSQQTCPAAISKVEGMPHTMQMRLTEHNTVFEIQIHCCTSAELLDTMRSEGLSKWAQKLELARIGIVKPSFNLKYVLAGSLGVKP